MGRTALDYYPPALNRLNRQSIYNNDTLLAKSIIFTGTSNSNTRQFFETGWRTRDTRTGWAILPIPGVWCKAEGGNTFNR